MSNLYSRLARRFGQTPTNRQRRDFLKHSAVLGAAALLSTGFISCAGTRRSILLSTRPRTTANPMRIAIVGGGFAGLACAHELHAIGHDITVFEARRRVGGRVLSLDEVVPGTRVEGGAELIGTNHPTWAAYANRFGLTFSEIDEGDDLDTPIVIDGSVMLADESEALFHEMERIAAKLSRLARAINPHEPWKSRNASALDEQSLAGWLDSIGGDATALRAFRAMLEGDNACPAERQSLLGVLAAIAGGGYEKYWTESEVYRCAQGNDALAAALAEPLGSRVHRETPVTAIERQPDGRMLVSAAGDRGSTFDHVVLAVPPTVWERITINPTLPDSLRPQIGDATKHLFRVSGQFWRDQGLAAWSLSNGLYSWSWEGTDGKIAHDAPADTARCFTLFAGGPPSSAVRALAPAERTDAVITDVERAYSAFRPSWLGQQWFMDWPSDPWTRGGYSSAAPGEITAVAPRLREGMPGLSFAGEHCSTAFPGYMEGALESGVRTAREIEARSASATR